MDSRIAILGANGTGKSTLLHLVTGALQPAEGTVQKHSQLKLAKYSQHSADQLPYDASPIEYFQSLFSAKYPDKDLQVRVVFFLPLSIAIFFFFALVLNEICVVVGMAFTVGPFRTVGCAPDFADQAVVGWIEE